MVSFSPSRRFSRLLIVLVVGRLAAVSYDEEHVFRISVFHRH